MTGPGSGTGSSQAATAEAAAPVVAVDRPTMWAAGTTVLFVVAGSLVLGKLPLPDALAGVVEALRNLVYAIALPVFDITRRLFARAALRRAGPGAVAPASGPNLLVVAFSSAMLVFAAVQAVSLFTGSGRRLAVPLPGRQCAAGQGLGLFRQRAGGAGNRADPAADAGDGICLRLDMASPGGGAVLADAGAVPAGPGGAVRLRFRAGFHVEARDPGGVPEPASERRPAAAHRPATRAS